MSAISLIGLVIGIICIFACRSIAIKKGRGPILWPILGFFFGLIALLIIALLPPKNA